MTQERIKQGREILKMIESVDKDDGVCEIYNCKKKITRPTIQKLLEAATAFYSIKDILADVEDTRPQTETGWSFRGTTKGKVLSLLDENEAMRSALEFIRDNTDETLANNVAFQALKGQNDEQT